MVKEGEEIEMKKIEKIQVLEILPDKKIVIITKYPKWLGWLVKLIDVYIVPSIHDYEMKINLKNITEIKYPKFIGRIGEIV